LVVTHAARPTTTAELASLVRESVGGVRVRGAASTGLQAAEGVLDLRLDALAGVVEYRPDDLVVTVRAGTTLDALDHVLREQRQRLPVAPWRAAAGTIGGAVAAAADGLIGARGLRVRDVVLGARAVLGNGDVVRVGARVVKSVSGFDVTRALVGSRGTLAALTELTLRVEALPESTVELEVACDDADDVSAVCAAALGDPLEPRGLAIRCAGDGAPIVVVAELAGPARAVAAASRRLADVGFRESPAGRRLADWTEHLARAPHRRRAACSRATPAASLRGAPGAVCDVRQAVTWLPESLAQPSTTSALWPALRAAFDPDLRLRPGRGLGAP
jgi:glycolate oxidase FAD binding subunit